MTKSEIVRGYAKRHKMPVVDAKLIDGEPEFEVMRDGGVPIVLPEWCRTPPKPSPTYEPEFEVMRDGGVPIVLPEWCHTPPKPVPTYEQAIVSMFREAKGIVEHGVDLKSDLLWAQGVYLQASNSLRSQRRAVALATHLKNPRSSIESFEKCVCKALDELWAAQEKYKAWAATYGDI